MRIGLFFGSFNPIHNGHLAIAQSILDQGLVDKVRFIVSPLSPFKKKPSLAHPFDRMDMVRVAIEENFNMEVSDVEFNLPTPNYTIDTLGVLSDKEPEDEFSLILGQDNLDSFHRWKKSDVILKHYELLVYRRSGSAFDDAFENDSVQSIEGPVIDISASFIRAQIKKGHSIKYLVPPEVKDFISSRNLYES